MLTGYTAVAEKLLRLEFGPLLDSGFSRLDFKLFTAPPTGSCVCI